MKFFDKSKLYALSIFLFPDFTRYKQYDRKLEDWRALDLPSDWNELRVKYQKMADEVFQNTILPLYHVPELTIHPDDSIPMEEAYDDHPGNKYAYGYNADAGDTGRNFLKSFHQFRYYIFFFVFFARYLVEIQESPSSPTQEE